MNSEHLTLRLRLIPLRFKTMVFRFPEQVITAGTLKDCIRLRGLPYEADVEQILNFLGEHGKNIVEHGIHMVVNSQVRKCKNGSFPASFFIFVFSTVISKTCSEYKILPMTGFEPRTSGIRSDWSANWATNWACKCTYSCMHFEWKSYGGSLVEGVEGQFHFGLMVRKIWILTCIEYLLFWTFISTSAFHLGGWYEPSSPSTNGLLHERANADNII